MVDWPDRKSILPALICTIVFVRNLVALWRDGGKPTRYLMLCISETIIISNLPEFAVLKAMALAFVLIAVMSAIVRSAHQREKHQLVLPTYLQLISLAGMPLSLCLQYGRQYAQWQKTTGYLVWYASMGAMSCGLIMDDIHKLARKCPQHKEKHKLLSSMFVYTFGLIYSLTKIMDYPIQADQDLKLQFVDDMYNIYDLIIN